ncbi:hypothetical protein GGP41_002292 [Bipolaris sorokiniana]|uniref:LysM domain-containing protein n=1 Tax=Cochliobolus sativus TaxID=45130 RepID=A0A8H5ZLT8_COCSA|nr:hypothetical protein GGP41_002292 [Bipolaris sorokiniana]
MFLFALITLIFTPIRLAVAQSYQLHPVVGSGLFNASSICQSVFSANVTCVNSIGQLYANPFYDPGDAELTALCTSACASSLDRQRTRVKGACRGAQYYDEYEDTYWLPQYLDEFILYAYNVACLKRSFQSTGEFCTSYLRNLKTAADCDECIIKAFQLQVNSPFAVDDGVRQNYASLTSSCKATQYPTTVATSLLLSTPTPTATCSGTTYVIQPTDTYRSVSQKQSVSTDHLLSSNGLPYNMTSFPNSGSLCISNRCKTYVLAQNDTCTSVAAKASISTVRLRAWNANINELCSNLARFTGDTICISNPYGDFSMPDTPTATPVETPAPLPTDLGNGIAPNVTSRCGKYYKVDVGDDCSTVSLKFNVAAKDL